MVKRKIQIKKRIEGNKRSIEEHKDKINTYDGNDPYLIPYWEKEIESRLKSIKEDEERLNKIVEEREKLHLSKILEYKSKTKRPLVIILGCWHLRENSLLRKKLKNYKIIAPLDENGGVLFEPNNSEIKYGEIISNEE